MLLPAGTQAVIADRLEGSLLLFEDQLCNSFRQDRHTTCEQDLLQTFRDILLLAPWVEHPRLQHSLHVLWQLGRVLLAGPDTAKNRAIHCYFRLQWQVLDDAQRGLHKILCTQLEAVLDSMAGQQSAEVVQTGAVQVLRLRQFLHQPTSSAGTGRFAGAKVSEPDGVRGLRHNHGNDIDQLLLLQARLTAEPDVSACLHATRCQLIDSLLYKLEHTNWQLEYFVSCSMAQLCRRLVQLCAYDRDGKLRQRCRQLESRLISLHLYGRMPPETVSQEIILALVRVQMQLNDEAALPEPAYGYQLKFSTSEQQAAAEHELARYADKISALLSGMHEAQDNAAGQTEALLLHLYKLAWVLDALGRHDCAHLALCLLQVCQQHWYLKLPLAGRFLHLLQAQIIPLCAGKTSTQPLEVSVHEPMSRIIACWPGSREHKLRVPLSAGQDKLIAITLENLPDYLSASFSVLLAVEKQWFVDAQVLSARRAMLLQELRLLEQGAAALKLFALEQYSGLLQDLYSLLQLQLNSIEYPAELLWSAHRHLLTLLDRAAAWLQPVPDDSAHRALQAWVNSADEHLQAIARHANSQTRHLNLQLLAFMRQLGKLLGRSLRLKLDCAADLPPDLQNSMLELLKELLRWMLLQNDVGRQIQQEELRPQAIIISIHIGRIAKGGWQMTLLDDSSDVLPAERQMQRLCKTAGIAAKDFQAVVPGGQGRRFVFAFAASG